MNALPAFLLCCVLGAAVAAHIAATVPNQWNGLPVGFYNAYLLPGLRSGEVDPTTQVLTALEILGFPTSQPA